MTTVLHCPTPPIDFPERPLAIRELNLSVTDVYRIHRQEYGPIYSTGKSNGIQYRFEAANEEFGVLDAAQELQGGIIVNSCQQCNQYD